ncbi:MAG: acetyl/propionyl/methylcrotonyl-CoA carboxylase subunit alpha [Limnobacter sp.]|nr:acetyl/propionyl/methylcrotonyl-CoA carboxylase subunit alpha [Limnobacter sp.]
MFKKILIANRGEIACRVIKTARRMGIQTVAVYSDADAKARHVRLADEAVHIGPSAVRESYLVIEKIIAAAKATGAEAIHPGYGFLSENEDFCHACDEAGIVFIGPPVFAIHAMGSKSEAKKLMGEAGVPLTPGYHGDNQDPEYLHGQADAIQYPVLIKAAAGGGGKGMRLVERSEDFPEALISCKREAISSFGDDHVLIEKYITQPRHIEIQVFADKLGNCVYLFERDCSVQRRHQKVLEEAPAPGMTLERRAAMGKAAVEAAKAVGYVGAGTVEFIANQDGTFYFMEMNTRLQVEHPVTEMITGLDLVEWQLKVATGLPLPLTQDQLQIKGHAMEARIYAEDPDKGFLPSTGRLIHLSTPVLSDDVRVDTGVEEGDEISPFYDPMIAKLIVWGEDRDTARLKMIRALADYQVVGVANNVSFLTRLCECESFANANLDTGLIEREKAFLLPVQYETPFETVALAALWKLLEEKRCSDALRVGLADATSPWSISDGWRLNFPAKRVMKFRVGEVDKPLTVVYQRDCFDMEMDGQLFTVKGGFVAGSVHELQINIGAFSVKGKVIAQGEYQEKLHVFLKGESHVLQWIDPLHYTISDHDHAGDVLAPMPGKVIALLAEVGARLEKGKPLMVLEAMKMEHTLHAPATGTLKAYRFAVGDQVKDGDELVEFEVES